MKRNRFLILACASLGLLASAPPGESAGLIPDTYPWVNVNRHFGASIRSGRVVPVTPNPGWGLGMSLKDGGVYLYGSEVSGWTASVDGGQTFDNANSGRVFSNNVCGGYPADWYSDGGDAASAAVCGPGAALALRPFVEGGPPSARPGFTGTTSFVNEVASGPAPIDLAGADVQGLCRGPTGISGCAKDVIYAANNALMTFSPDAGRQWFPLSPACELRRDVTFSSIAADRGKPGHVVALASHFSGHGQGEASGCDAAKKTDLVADVGTCALRTIAYTDNIGEELKESILATTLTGGNTAPDGKMRLERAGGGGAGPDLGDAKTWEAKDKWRYATINNLPAPASIGGACAIGIGSPGGGQGSVIHPDCSAQPSHHCHGRKSDLFKVLDPITNKLLVADPSAWCLNPTDDNCKCSTGPAAVCRYPSPTHLEIDPRNGWAYLSSDVGLLTSPDGGGHWIREGDGPASNPADKFDSFLGARLYTHRFHGSLTETPSALTSLNLNKDAARIRTVGDVSLAFTSCGNGAKYSNGRDRGHLVATVPITWNWHSTANPAWTSGVFVAAVRADCADPQAAPPPPGALEFWDSAHLWLDGAPNKHPDLGDYQLKPWAAFDKVHPKLLHSLPLSERGTTRMFYSAAAVSPSDPRVLWAWSYGTVVPDPATIETQGLGMHLWRSINGGGTWSIALPAWHWIWPAGVGRSGGGIRHLAKPVLSVSPANPYQVMVSAGYEQQHGSGADGAWIAEAVPEEEVLADPAALPQPGCAACQNTAGALSCEGQCKFLATYGDAIKVASCNPKKQPPNFCSAMHVKTMSSEEHGLRCFDPDVAVAFACVFHDGTGSSPKVGKWRELLQVDASQFLCPEKGDGKVIILPEDMQPPAQTTPGGWNADVWCDYIVAGSTNSSVPLADLSYAHFSFCEAVAPADQLSLAGLNLLTPKAGTSSLLPGVPAAGLSYPTMARCVGCEADGSSPGNGGPSES